MLRLLGVWLLVAVAAAGLAAAQPRATDTGPEPKYHRAALAVWDVMRLDEFVRVLQGEAVAEARDLVAGLFPEGGDGGWLDRVGAIHQPDRIRALFLAHVASVLPRTSSDDVQKGLAFYKTGLGRRILSVEIKTRAALLNPAAERAARVSWARALALRDPRALQVLRLIGTADLIEPNVAGGMNASVAFARGFRDGDGVSMPLSDRQIIEEAWSRETQLRDEVAEWIGAYLFLAYAPLSSRELDMYIIFSASDGGRALSRLIFSAFEAVYFRTSHDMGRAAAAQLRGRRL